MIRFLVSVILLLVILPMRSQGNFKFSTSKSKTTIPFKLINNLIIVPAKLNGVNLNFLLDTGVEETILFSLEETDDIQFENVEKIRLRGLGKEESIEGLKSSRNKLEFKDLHDDNHDIYIVLDQDFNFSSHIGIPVNGIIGYQFFRNNLVEIDYDSKKIIVHQNADKAREKFNRKFTGIPMSIEFRKPYIVSKVAQNGKRFHAKLLADIGNSDAVWLFEQKSDSIDIPEKTFDDFLGRGFSGEIHGKRGRIDTFELGGFVFETPIAAFPDSTSIRHVSIVSDRVGSIGGEIFKRFDVVFDYQNRMMYLKKGDHFDAPFHYNMSGIDVEHAGLQWIKESVQKGASMNLAVELDSNFERVRNDFQYKFELKPMFKISDVRPDSPAAEAKLEKDDILKTINGKSAYKLTLEQINQILRSEVGREIRIEVERKGQLIKAKFKLRTLL
ncbi:MAG: PDZ domain-containing protein [Flavobacterium sp.]|uniref:aspartyl protease family protein n=1 Tax=Flavobacterium sp. TaxID=239 RepID=UPI00122B4239|nr:aspartyl protease family protein [Flavobacterium sp.]RZJ65758.1 MAG: PDZ domain-containing protein [Flavobacterium sp.]